MDSGAELTPVFLFSLPRAGSTLLQRILAAHEEIATTSEPWVLLPYLYTLRSEGVYAEYYHTDLSRALEDFCDELPNGVDDYLVEMRSFLLRLYHKAANDDARYFLDKTPRYSLVAEDIMRLFPEGKFIFLWRNPLAIVASQIETWGAPHKWNLHGPKVDLFHGLASLVAAYQKYGERACAVNYEHLISAPEEVCQRLFAYLDLEFDPEVLVTFSQVQLRGRRRDPTGIGRYQTLSNEPLEKWKDTLANPVRKSWCRLYLRWIGRERLEAIGYDPDSLTDELNKVPYSMRYIASDLARMTYGAMYIWGESDIFLDKLRKLPHLWSVNAHR